jgi:hypothetical protein
LNTLKSASIPLLKLNVILSLVGLGNKKTSLALKKELLFKIFGTFGDAQTPLP